MSLTEYKGITKRIDAVTNIGDLRIQMGGIQPAPKSVKIELVARCNLNCKYCATSMRTQKPKKDMDFWLFKKITEDMRMCGVEEIGLFYLGESTLNPPLLLKSIEWCKHQMNFPYVFLTSNATVVDEDFASSMMSMGLDSLKWSVNFKDESQFEEMTGSNKKLFHRALKNIKDAWNERSIENKNTILTASSILYSKEHKEAMQPFLDEHIIPYVDEHYWLPLYQMTMFHDYVIEQTGFTPTHGNMGRLDNDTLLPIRKPLPCWTVFTEGHVRVDGGLAACCFGNDDKFDMGVLDGRNFMYQWNSEKFQRIREAQLRTLTEGQKALINTPCHVCVVWE